MLSAVTKCCRIRQLPSPKKTLRRPSTAAVLTSATHRSPSDSRKSPKWIGFRHYFRIRPFDGIFHPFPLPFNFPPSISLSMGLSASESIRSVGTAVLFRSGGSAVCNTYTASDYLPIRQQFKVLTTCVLRYFFIKLLPRAIYV